MRAHEGTLGPATLTDRSANGLLAELGAPDRYERTCLGDRAAHHYDLAESGLADLGRVGFDDAGHTVEVLVAMTHATLAIAGEPR